MKRAPIAGITGQDGSYPAELLLSKGYEEHGIIQRASTSFHDGLRQTIDWCETSRRAAPQATAC